jgi:hypothetical protein
MARRVSRVSAVVPGKRVGTKRRDMRWLAPDGTEWDSKFEYEVFLTYQKAGLNVRRTTEQDSLLFTRPVRNGTCAICGSCEVASRHRYTPDLHVGAEDDRERSSVQTASHYEEVKGYLRADQRSLLRALRKAKPDVDLRAVVQRDYKVGKGTVCQWFRKYLKMPCVVWNGEVPKWGV